MFRALEHAQQRLFSGAITAAGRCAAALRDNAALRAKGVDGYGFGPWWMSQETHGAHSEDERYAGDIGCEAGRVFVCTVVEVAAAP